MMCVLIPTTISLGTASADNHELTAKELVNKLQQYYASSSDYQATFVQTSAHRMFNGRLQRAYGKVLFRKGGLMRWEYQRPDKKYFIYDGSTLWIYEPEVPQIFAGTADTERLNRALAFLTGEGRILDEYKVKVLDSSKFRFQSGFVLGLTPKDKRSPFKRVELYLDQTSFRVVRSVVVDQEGNRNRLDFSDPKVNNNLSEEVFTFTPPPGVPVIRPDQQP
jgi:outer membrane lipoprotein carrier protein